MKSYNIEIIETYIYNIDIEANNEKEALRKAKDAYKNDEAEFNGIFIADATSFENTKFKVTKKIVIG